MADETTPPEVAVAPAAPAKAEPFIVGLRLQDPTKVELSGRNLPYMSDLPYLAIFEITGQQKRGFAKIVPHPTVVAEVLAAQVTPQDITLSAVQSITAVNPTRRGLLMEPTHDLATYADSIKATLEAAGFRVGDYPLAMLLGDSPIGDVKAQRGQDFALGAPVLVGVGGGWIDPYELSAAGSEAEVPEETPTPETATEPVSDDTLVAAGFASPTMTLTDIEISDDTAPWEGIIAVEGVETGDGRFLEGESLSWRDLPLPLMMMTENPVGGTGHDGAKLVGRIDKIERRDAELWAAGVIDLGSENGAEAHRLLEAGMLRGVSADIDQVEWAADGAIDPLEALLGGEGSQRVAKGRMMGATLCTFPALQECSVWLVDGEQISEDPEALAASGGNFPGRIVWYTPLNDTGALVASAGYPVEPPASWFANPKLEGPQGLTVTKEGRVFGHVAAWGACHIGFGGGRCVAVPRSNTRYSAFLTGKVLTAEGVEVRTGVLTIDTVHPDLKLQASDAQAFYAHTGSGAADLSIGEDAHGIYVAGAVRSDTTPAQVRAMRASDVSPDWRTVNGKPRELCALLAVNNSGFKLPALVASAAFVSIDAGDWVQPGHTSARIVDGHVEALVASSMINGENLLEAMGAEVSGMRDEIQRLSAHLRPAMVAKAREKALGLASSKKAHPSAQPKLDELSVARKRLARARALRLAGR